MNIVKYIVFFGLAYLYLIPVIMMVFGSLKEASAALAFDLSFPETLEWSNYSYVFEKGNILNGYKNSLIITVSSTLFTIIFGGFAGIIISRRNDRITSCLYYYLIFGLTMTLQTASTFWMLTTLGLYGTRFAVIGIYIGMRMPFTIMTFTSFVKGVPRDIDEAAIMDGCSPTQLIFKVLLPILKPIAMTNVVVTAISCWNDFMVPLFYLGSAAKWTVPLAIYNFFGLYSRNWNYVFACLVLTVLPIIILFLFLQKYIVSGMTAGAVKG